MQLTVCHINTNAPEEPDASVFITRWGHQVSLQCW